jgi:vancomycin resistance protein VanW
MRMESSTDCSDGSRRHAASRIRPLHFLSVVIRRSARGAANLAARKSYATTRCPDSLPHLVIGHCSLLLRRLEGTDPRLQENKAVSLRLACEVMDGTIISPGETFSFWRIVGRPGTDRGFLPGLQLDSGRLVSRSGGGLCQLSNLLHWMILHTTMDVTERHRHGTDPFPDYRRTVPFGTGATVFWNYLDLAFRNSTHAVFQVRTWVNDEYLCGEIRSDSAPAEVISVEERGHRFVRAPGGPVYRENELWRLRSDASTGALLSEERIMANRIEVLYDPLSIPGNIVEEFTDCRVQ